MNTKLLLTALVLLIGNARAALEKKTLSVDGVSREYLIHVPVAAATTPAPLVFTFHGHGGTAGQAARSFGMHAAWPDAVCVYMQGLPTVGQLTDPEGRRPGWQKTEGDQGDRDLKFFDATLQAVQTACKIDPARIYATGHSNGGGFTYLLCAARPAVFAAVAPSGAAAIRTLPRLKARPVLHIAGRNDPLVKFSWQQTTMNGILRINGCSKESTAWEGAQIFPSPTGTPMVQYIHDGGHRFPAVAPALIVKFFKEHKLPAGD